MAFNEIDFRFFFLFITCCWLPCQVESGHQMTVRNKCNQVIWAGTHGDNDTPANGGFRLNPGQSRKFALINGWTSGRIWPRTGCDQNGQNCESGDCGAGNCRKRTVFDAVTLAEFGLDKYKGLDFFDISYVDGFNVPVSIRPIPGTVKPNSDNKCRQVSCGFDMSVCPQNFLQKGRNGKIVGCKSACSATKEDKYCCPGWKGYTRDNCPQPSDYSKIFKKQCYDSCTWAFDDQQPMFACESKNPNSSSYEVIFC